MIWPMNMDMKSFARVGAQARLAELQQEIERINRAFPTLRKGKPARVARKQSPQPEQVSTRTRKPMSAAAKKAVGERMKKYWAARRKAKLAPAAQPVAQAPTAKTASKGGAKKR
jgi:hypothetical protein